MILNKIEERKKKEKENEASRSHTWFDEETQRDKDELEKVKQKGRKEKSQPSRNQRLKSSIYGEGAPHEYGLRTLEDLRQQREQKDNDELNQKPIEMSVNSFNPAYGVRLKDRASTTTKEDEEVELIVNNPAHKYQ